MLTMSLKARLSRLESYCRSCRNLFSPEGLREARTPKGFFHSRVDQNGRLPCKDECKLCSYLESVFFDLYSEPDADLFPEVATQKGDVRFIAHEAKGLNNRHATIVHDLVCHIVPDGQDIDDYRQTMG